MMHFLGGYKIHRRFQAHVIEENMRNDLKKQGKEKISADKWIVRLHLGFFVLQSI